MPEYHAYTPPHIAKEPQQKPVVVTDAASDPGLREVLEQRTLLEASLPKIQSPYTEEQTTCEDPKLKPVRFEKDGVTISNYTGTVVIYVNGRGTDIEHVRKKESPLVFQTYGPHYIVYNDREKIQTGAGFLHCFAGLVSSRIGSWAESEVDHSLGQLCRAALQQGSKIQFVGYSQGGIGERSFLQSLFREDPDLARKLALNCHVDLYGCRLTYWPGATGTQVNNYSYNHDPAAMAMSFIDDPINRTKQIFGRELSNAEHYVRAGKSHHLADYLGRDHVPFLMQQTQQKGTTEDKRGRALAQRLTALIERGGRTDAVSHAALNYAIRSYEIQKDPAGKAFAREFFAAMHKYDPENPTRIGNWQCTEKQVTHLYHLAKSEEN